MLGLFDKVRSALVNDETTIALEVAPSDVVPAVTVDSEPVAQVEETGSSWTEAVKNWFGETVARRR